MKMVTKVAEARTKEARDARDIAVDTLGNLNKKCRIRKDVSEEERNVFAEPVQELRYARGLEHRECVKLTAAMCGLVNAPGCWRAPRVRRDMANLGWPESSIEPCPWYL